MGSLSLIAGFIAIVSRKGGAIHKKAGRVFYYTMLSSSTIAMIIATLPKHQNPFLFAIGIFSCYLLIGGKRAILYKNPQFNSNIDRVLAILSIVLGMGMIAVPIITNQALNIVLSVFGTLSIWLGTIDIINLKNNDKLKDHWLRLHVGKIMGGYISAVSAFFVVNQILPGIWNWFSPGIVGGAFIFYWLKKLPVKKHKSEV